MKLKKNRFKLIISCIASIIILSLLCLFLLNHRENQIKHIFLITIDTLRADHLSCYGYPRQTSPFLDSLADGGVLFKNSYSSSATTAPSHASIFTSHYPFSNGVIKNWYKLDARFDTLAEILKQEGFNTYAFTSVELFNACDLYQGFDYYDEPVDAKKKWSRKYRQADLTFEKVKQYFDKKVKIPKTFTWIHLFDPHRPYYPPEKYLSKIKALKDKDKMIKFWEMTRKISPEVYRGEVFLWREKSQFYKDYPDYYKNWKGKDIMYDQINLYDAEILFVDDQLRSIYDYFEKKGLNEKSLWIITADHGEGLGNHNWFVHSRDLYMEDVKIPLIFYMPGSKSEKKVNHIVEGVDIFPTLLDILKIDFDTNIIAGVSLKNDIFGEGGRYHIKKYSFSEREYYKPRNYLKEIPPYFIYEHGDKFSLQSDSYQYIYRTKGENELYNLKNDPYEINNIISENFRVRKKMKFEILKILRKYSKKNLKVKKGTKKEIEKIKSLGYIE